MITRDEIEQEYEQMMANTQTVETDLTAITRPDHRFERIVGNQLMCTAHDAPNCPRLTIKPTEVLEKGEDGKLHLVDMARDLS